MPVNKSSNFINIYNIAICNSYLNDLLELPFYDVFDVFCTRGRVGKEGYVPSSGAVSLRSSGTYIILYMK